MGLSVAATHPALRLEEQAHGMVTARGGCPGKGMGRGAALQGLPRAGVGEEVGKTMVGGAGPSREQAAQAGDPVKVGLAQPAQATHPTAPEVVLGPSSAAE
eukprot:scaffold62094_cov19-Tisochrysis_lutea.AAC.1